MRVSYEKDRSFSKLFMYYGLLSRSDKSYMYMFVDAVPLDSRFSSY